MGEQTERERVLEKGSGRKGEGEFKEGVRKVHKQRWLGFETSREVAGKEGIRGRGESSIE